MTKKKKETSEGWCNVRGHTFIVSRDEEGVPLDFARYDDCSLWIFDSSSELRKFLVWLIKWKWFDRFITTVILCNSISLCMTDLSERVLGDDYFSTTNFQLERINLIFTGIFIFECVTKIIAEGFIFHKHSYMRSSWNWLDFFVVMASLIDFLPGGNIKGLKALRTFRILRPLKTVKAFPTMSALIQTLFRSLPGLSGVMLFLVMTFALFAIFGVQIFPGAQYQFCRVSAEPITTYNEKKQLLTYDWPIVSTFAWNCQKDKDCETLINYYGPDPNGPDPPIYKCGASIDYGIKAGGKMQIDDVAQNANLLFDIVNFNHFLAAFLTIYQVLSMENWTDGMMYNYMDATNKFMSVFYFIFLVVGGAFFMFNLFLAQIIASFEEQAENMVIEDPVEIRKNFKIKYVELKNQREQDGIQDNADGDDEWEILCEVRHAVGGDDEDEEKEESGSENNDTVKEEKEPQKNEKVKEEQEPENNEKVQEEQEPENNNTQRAQEDDVKEGQQIIKHESQTSFQKEMEVVPCEDQTSEGGECEEMAETEPLDDSAFFDEAPHETGSRKRSHQNIIYRRIYQFVTHWFVNFLITIVIVLNTGSLAADSFNPSFTKEKLLKSANNVFTWVFAAEMILKIIGLGPKYYAKEAFNLFDSFVVCVSIIDFTINQVLGDGKTAASGVLLALRSLRLLRIIKVLRRWKAIQEIIRKTLLSVDGIMNFSALLFLFMYIFSLLGMQLFAKKAYKDLNDRYVLQSEIIERFSTEILIPVRDSFDNVFLGMNTVVIFIMADGWNWVMYDNISTFNNRHIYSIFFVILFFLFNKVMLSLFVAILLSNFDDDGEDDEQNQEEVVEQEPVAKPPLFKRLFNKEKFEAILFSLKDAFGHRITVAAQRQLEALEQKKSQDLLSQRAAAPPSGKQNSQREDLPKQFQDNSIEKSELSSRREENDRSLSSKINKSNRSEKIKNSNQSIQKDYDILPNDKEIAEFAAEDEVQKEKQDQYINFEQKAELQMAGTELFTDIKNSKTPEMNRSTSPLKKSRTQRIPTTEEVETVSLTDTIILEGRSLFLFTATNCCMFRRKVLKFISHSAFDNIILLLIAISTINLAVEGPLDQPGCMKLQVLQYIDWFMTACFTLEMSSKIIVYGFVFNGKQSYLRVSWNILDFMIVSSALVSLNPNMGKNLKVLKTLRILRVLRPLRMISKNKGLKISITALIQSLPDIGNLQLIVFFFLFLFGILHVTLFSGLFWSCSSSHLVENGSITYQQSLVLIQGKWDCINMGGEWINADFHFDNIFASLMTLFSIQSTEGWNDPLQFAQIDGTDQNMSPKRWAKPYYAPFAIIVEIVSNVFFLNLFVGVVCETFNKNKNGILGLSSLDDRTIQWIQCQIMSLSANPLAKIVPLPQFSKLRNKVIQFVYWKGFDRFIMGCIFGNTICLTLNFYGQPDSFEQTLNYLNYFFVAVFSCECIIKLFALHKFYFKAGWNIFDLVFVVFTLLFLLVGFIIKKDLASQTTILRSLRIVRLLKVAKIKKLQVIFSTMTEAAPSLGSLGLLLMLIIFMYSIIGMKFFGFINIDSQSTVHYHNNCKNWFQTFILLFRSATGEAWDGIMLDYARGKSVLFQCVDEMDYESLVANNMKTNKCGTPISFPFFITFMMIVCQIFLNLFIAIIVDSFTGQEKNALLPVRPEMIESFQDVWLEFDVNGKGYFKCSDLEAFLIALEKAQCPLLPPNLKKPLERQEQETWRDYVERMNVYRMDYFDTLSQFIIYNDFTQEKREDVPNIAFSDVLFSMVRLKFESYYNNMINNEQKGKIENEDEVGIDFEAFQGGLDFNSRQIEVLKDLREMAQKVEKQIKNRSKKADQIRQNFLEEDYQKFVNLFNQMKANRIKKRGDQVIEFETSNFLSTEPMNLTQYEKEIFNIEYTAQEYQAIRIIEKCFQKLKQEKKQDNVANKILEMVAFSKGKQTTTESLNAKLLSQDDASIEDSNYLPAIRKNRVVPLTNLPIISESDGEDQGLKIASVKSSKRFALQSEVKPTEYDLLRDEQ